MGRPKVDIELKFHQHYTVDWETGCWPWASTGPGGYGTMISSGTKHFLPHRLAYQLYVGPIPDGLHIDHTCHDPLVCHGGVTCPHRRCVNPAHLEAVTQQENSRRAFGPRVTCGRGHALTPENVAFRDGRRSCRECVRITQRIRRSKHRGVTA